MRFLERRALKLAKLSELLTSAMHWLTIANHRNPGNPGLALNWHGECKVKGTPSVLRFIHWVGRPLLPGLASTHPPGASQNQAAKTILRRNVTPGDEKRLAATGASSEAGLAGVRPRRRTGRVRRSRTFPS